MEEGFKIGKEGEEGEEGEADLQHEDEMAPLGGDQYLDYSKFDILSEAEKPGKIERTYKTA